MKREAENFPELLKEVRQKLGITQEELAHELGVSFATVNRWENGKTKPSRLAKASFKNFCSEMASQGKLSHD